jgi:hypothetical protein
VGDRRGKTTFQFNSVARPWAEIKGTVAPHEIASKFVNILTFPRSEVAVDLELNDIDAIVECARSLPGQWGAKIMRIERSKDRSEANWGYIFRREQPDDIAPVLSISRTSTRYTIVAWDLLEFVAEGCFSEYFAATIGEVLTTVRRIVLSLLGAEDHDVVEFRRPSSTAAMATNTLYLDAVVTD